MNTDPERPRLRELRRELGWTSALALAVRVRLAEHNLAVL